MHCPATLHCTPTPHQDHVAFPGRAPHSYPMQQLVGYSLASQAMNTTGSVGQIATRRHRLKSAKGCSICEPKSAATTATDNHAPPSQNIGDACTKSTCWVSPPQGDFGSLCHASLARLPPDHRGSLAPARGDGQLAVCGRKIAKLHPSCCPNESGANSRLIRRFPTRGIQNNYNIRCPAQYERSVHVVLHLDTILTIRGAMPTKRICTCVTLVRKVDSFTPKSKRQGLKSLFGLLHLPHRGCELRGLRPFVGNRQLHRTWGLDVILPSLGWGIPHRPPKVMCEPRRQAGPSSTHGPRQYWEPYVRVCLPGRS